MASLAEVMAFAARKATVQRRRGGGGEGGGDSCDAGGKGEGACESAARTHCAAWLTADGRDGRARLQYGFGCFWLLVDVTFVTHAAIVRCTPPPPPPPMMRRIR